MSSFQVDPELLGVAASRVGGNTHIVAAVASAAPIGDLGDAWLIGVARRTDDAACRELGKVARVLQGMESTLRQAAAIYLDSDGTVRDAAQGGGR